MEETNHAAPCRRQVTSLLNWCIYDQVGNPLLPHGPQLPQ